MKKTLLLFAINILLAHSNFVYSANDYNIILNVPDDHARRTIGVYGNKAAITPNLDKIARHGYKMLGVRKLVAEAICGKPSSLLDPFRFSRYEEGDLHPVSNSPFPWS